MKVYLPLKIILLVLLFCFSLVVKAQVEQPKDSISNQLEEIVIATAKKTFTNENGNIKLEVPNSIFSAIPNTIDLLSKLPKVQISPDREKISVVGRGVPLIYIDNQKVGMNDLNALAVEDIKTIEIIQNPSSKYEAEGRSVILVTRKFSKKDSFKIDVTEVASQKKDFNNYLGFNSSFKKNKLEWKANFNYNALQPWETHKIDYTIPSSGIVSNYNVEAFTNRRQYLAGGGLFYKINDDDYISVSVNNNLRTEDFDINTLTYNKNKEVENNVLTRTNNDQKRNFINSFLNYSKKIKAIDALLFTGLQYSNYDSQLLTKVANNYNDSQFEWSQNRDQQFNVDVFSGRVDVEKTFSNKMKLEVGGLYSQAKSKSDFGISYYENNQEDIKHYDFKEANLAGYTQFSGTIKKVEFSLGFRAENTNVKGQFASDETPLLTRKYTNIFPKAQFTFPIDSVKSISINYAKSIQRPNYSSLSQRATYINPYFLYGGNVNLSPTFTNEIATTFQYHDKSIKLSYFVNKDPVYSSFSFDEQQNVLTLKDLNYERESSFNVELTLPFTYKIWTSTNSFVFVVNKIEDKSVVNQASTPYLYYNSSQEFRLPKQFVFGVSCWGMTKQNDGVFKQNEKFLLDLSLSKTIKNWKCTLSCNDIFKTTSYKEEFAVNNVSSKARYLVDSNEVAIAIKYSFGKVKNTEYKEKNVNESENRIR